MDIASGSVLPVAQWTSYVHVICGSGQTGRTSGKYCFVMRFIICMVHKMLLMVPNERKLDEYGMWYGGGKGGVNRVLVGKDE